MSNILPADVSAYMTEATESLIRHQGFSPENEESLRDWITTHMDAITNRASSAMIKMVTKVITNDQMSDEGAKILSDKVHARFQKLAA